MNDFERIYEEIRREEVGTWFTKGNGQKLIIVKIPLNTCKAIIHGCKTQIIIGLDNTKDSPILHSGFRAYDDLKSPMIITNAHRHSDEHETLLSVINEGEAGIVLYSELCLPLIYGKVQLNAASCSKVVDMTKPCERFYFGDNNDEINLSLDSFQFSIDHELISDQTYKIYTVVIDCEMSDWNSPEHHLIGLSNQEKMKVIDPREGDILEKHVWFALESVFPFDLHLNPKYRSGDLTKEFIDVFSCHDYGHFMIEAKGLSIFEGAIEKTMERKVLSTQKHIRKAIKQLVGANQTIQRGESIYSSSGEIIDFNRDLIPHCIVLVAEVYHFGEWKDIEMMIMKTMAEQEIYLHVFDLRELLMLLKISRGNKIHFDYHLMERAKHFVEHQSIHMRTEPGFL